MIKKTSLKTLSSPAELKTFRQKLLSKRDPAQLLITVCGGTGCTALRSQNVIEAFRSELERHDLSDKIVLRTTGCHGFCERGPIVVIKPEGTFYQRVMIKDVAEIVSSAASGTTIDRLLFTDTAGKKAIHESEIPFYQKQVRHIIGSNTDIDPTSISDYIAIGGYTALTRALFEMKPDKIIAEIKKSGLRGRGGAGFPTGLKWESTQQARGDIKYVICNADEGDPGAYMDRSLMEGNPHSVLEGMIIGALAIGSHEGYIYIRNEYPLAVKNTRLALEAAEDLGLLGDNIMGSGFSLHIKINRGGGAFVCGESTALVSSLEGRVGEPRAKYVHLAEKGLWDKPTDLNNVETWANIPLIINKGAAWYSKIGTAGSKGTKIFSLVGKINNTGLVEVPMGITLREIIYDIGGGIPGGKKFKAVQTGGPSGGCIPASLLDMHVDYDELARAGSMMGSGAMIVMDEKNCMVDIARYYLSFLEEESCGKCVPCREGIKQMKEILTDISEGRGKEGDVELLQRLATTLVDASLCQLGATAPNPVITAIKYFRDEFDAHIRDKKCPAGVCKTLVKYEIKENCVACGLCLKVCPQGAITVVEKKKPVKLDQTKCIKCGSCFDACKLAAIAVR